MRRNVQRKTLPRPAEPLAPAQPGEPLPLAYPQPRRRLRPGLIGWLVLALGAGAGTAYWYWSAGGPEAVPFNTALVDRGPIVEQVTATGTVNPVTSVQVGSQVSGRIKAIYVDYNSVVTKGQPIAQIDPAPFQARVEQARANLQTARTALERARISLAQRKLDLDRMETLRRQQFVAQADVDLAGTNFRDAQAQVEAGKAQVDQAKAALAAAELDLGYTAISSPVNGIVITRNVDVGQTVAASFQTPILFVIAEDLTRMQVNASVSEADIGGVTEGGEAEFTVDAYPGQTFHGTVTQVRNTPISIQNVVTYDVIIGVENPDFRLKPGMTASVTVVKARENQALRVPNNALRFKPPGTPILPGKPTVWVLEPSGTHRAVEVQPGISDSQYTQVLRGALAEGDRVIVGLKPEQEPGQQTLPPGFGVRMPR